MSKRPLIDLSALTSEQAMPMPEAVQRAASNTSKALAEEGKGAGAVKTPHLEALAFKVSPAFRKRFKERALAADLKLNELLFAALDAWEAQQGLKK